MEFLALIVFLICFFVVQILTHQRGWLRHSLQVLELMKKARVEKNPNILNRGILDLKLPKWYEVFLSPKQIEKLEKEKKGGEKNGGKI